MTEKFIPRPHGKNRERFHHIDDTLARTVQQQ